VGPSIALCVYVQHVPLSMKVITMTSVTPKIADENAYMLIESKAMVHTCHEFTSVLSLVYVQGL